MSGSRKHWKTSQTEGRSQPLPLPPPDEVFKTVDRGWGKPSSVSNSEAVTRNGFFSIGSHHNLPGTLFLQSSNSILNVWLNHPSNLDILKDQDIYGILDNGDKVSLINCIMLRGNSAWKRKNTSTITNLQFFPHYVILGHEYLRISDEIIAGVSFQVNDGYALFGNYNSLSTLNLNSNQVKELSRLGIFDDIKLTKDNDITIAYSVGYLEIFSVNTIIGEISVHNSANTGRNFKEGLYMKRNISIDLKFINSLNMEKMREKINKILRFLEIISGCPQNIAKIEITIGKDQSVRTLSVYLNAYSNDKNMQNYDPSPADVLICAGDQPNQFTNLISNWLKRDEDEAWQIARERFSNVWSKQRNYDPDRIVAAANMFDLLPKSVFRPIKELKKKIRCRSRLVKNAISHNLENIDYITDQAVELRNLYVHGDKSNGSRKKLMKFLPLLTDTLEFVFCASDLIELEWDFLSWYEASKSKKHPLGIYIHYTYPDQSERFLAYLRACKGPEIPVPDLEGG